MARIYVARSTGIGAFERHVVLKMILPERAHDEASVQMFLNEARLAASLNHQNVAQVFEVGEEGGIHFLAMEYVHGQDLRGLLARAGSQGTRVPLELALTVAAGAAAGLHHAHERRNTDGTPMGIVHRDVSPSNIMVGYDGSVKLLDFGIAKAALRSIETQSGIIKGKFAYMSPEQCRGREVDRRSDVFSLGIILYEVTTQHRCFRADSDFDTMHRIVTGDVVRPSRLVQNYPAELEAIVMQALSVDPAQRPPSAGALLEAIEGLAAASRLSLSTMALGRFMRDMFGDVDEPWLTTGRHHQPVAAREQTISNTHGTGAQPASVAAQLAAHHSAPMHLPVDLPVDLAVDLGAEPLPSSFHRPVAAVQGLAGGSQPIPPIGPIHPMSFPPVPGSGSGPAMPFATGAPNDATALGEPPFTLPPDVAMPLPHPAPPPFVVSLSQPAPPPSPGMLPIAPGSAPFVRPASPSLPGMGSAPFVRVADTGTGPAARQSNTAPGRVALPGLPPVAGATRGHDRASGARGSTPPPHRAQTASPVLPYQPQPPPIDPLHMQVATNGHRWLYIGLGIALVGIVIVLAIPSARDAQPGQPPATTVTTSTTSTTGEPAAAPSAPVPAAPAAPTQSAAAAATPIEPAHPEPTSAPIEPEPQITIRITSVPAGAEVTLAGAQVGSTPIELHLRRKQGFAPLIVHRARYVDVTSQVDLSTDYTSNLKLTAISDESTARPASHERPAPPPAQPHESRHAAPAQPTQPPQQPATPSAPKRCQPPGRINPFDTSCNGKPCPACPTSAS